MNLKDRKPGKLPFYVYYIIAVVVIFLFNLLVVPSIREKSIVTTDYSTFLKEVDAGNVTKAEVQTDYIYYTENQNGMEILYKTVRMDDPDLVKHLYEKGTSMEGVAPQRENIFLTLILGYVIPIAAFVLLGRWLSKKMMGSMGGAAGLAVLSVFMEKAFWPYALAMALIIIFKHRSNIKRLIKGEEPPLNFKK